MRPLLLLTLCMMLPAHAEETIEYQFDIILFEELSSNQAYLSDLTAHEYMSRKRQQSLDDMAEQPVIENAETEQTGPVTFTSDDPEINFQKLEGGILDDSFDKLEASSRYRVIERKTWKQPAFSDGDSIRIDIEADMPDDDVSGELLPTDNRGTVDHYLSGSVKFTFSRYIHLSTALIKKHVATDIQTDLPLTANLPDTSFISVERKLRSNETHYVDHPLLGIVIHIQKLKVQQADT